MLLNLRHPSPRRALHHLLPRRPVRDAKDLAPLPQHAEIVSTGQVAEKKSVFVGHAVRVKSVDEATLALQHILTLKKVNKASHNILAWRFSSPVAGSTTPLSGSDCNGEPPAGKNLLQLLEKLDVKDVLLVVTRWYGGVPMGPQRFQVINQAGKEVLELDFGQLVAEFPVLYLLHKLPIRTFVAVSIMVWGIVVAC
ncbi:hypothetical protein JCM6882_006990 [Rhodosporidiobolus microsporus]